jgi:hypothetical protein
MATQADVRRVALTLPGTEEANHFAFAVRNKGKPKGYAWVWMERVTPKKPRVPNPAVIAVRVANLAQRDVMLAADPVKFFTEPHYAGFPAVLVRLEKVTVADLKVLLAEGWRCQAPADLVQGPKRSAERKKSPDRTKAKAKRAVRKTVRRRDASTQ